MQIYYPALVTSAIFFAAIAVNLRNQDYAAVFGLALLAIPSLLFLTFLSLYILSNQKCAVIT